ncbi:Ger(x)C family spore germination protein [Brevibacillus dissolubilis]|uniref:Ger(x)C family spore germination protein n=1 Tax=Brevibacillus dissolubilis TaxID=1844116 RepID=UPI0011167975|nr:Ger(x)C family spore germination protein [Brevibacillus dissolubilis]
MRTSAYLFSVLLLLTSTLLGGCWDRREINDVAFVMLTAMDKGKKEGTYTSYIQVAVPVKMGGGQAGSSPGGKGEKPYMTLHTTGRNLDEMRIEGERQLSRDMSVAHRRVLMIGESLAKKGIKPILDTISRNPKNRLRTMLVFTKGMDAREMISMKYDLEPFPSEVFREMITRKGDTPTTMRDFFIMATTPGVQPVASAFSRRGVEHSHTTLESIAIFRDFKLVGYVDEGQAMLLNSLLGRTTLGIIKVHLDDVPGHISIQLGKLQTKGDVKIQGDEPQFQYKVQATGHITENTTNLDLSNPKYVSQINKEFRQQLKDGYDKLLKSLQKQYKADSIGLGTLIYRSNPTYWKKIEKQWPKLFTKQKVQWSINANVREIGVTGPPLALPDDEVKK